MLDLSKENLGESNGASLNSGVCPECSKNLGKNLFAHLFDVHSYTKEEIANLQAAKRRKILGEHNYLCDSCETTFATKKNLLEHNKMEHTSRKKISCPLCGTSINDHHDLVIHANAAHASGDRTFSVETISFNSRSAFQDWKHALEEEQTTSRAEPGPSYIEKCTSSKKTVLYCTAYMKVTEKERSINVEFCRTHCGHEPDPALLTMDANAEKQILFYLKNGFTYRQVLSQVRERCRNSNNLNCRLYFTTSRDVRRIAFKYNLDPARRHSIDILSLEMRINDHNPDNGIRHYAAATDATGDNFSLVIVTPTQKLWLESYAKRALLMDDTFNLTPYSLRLASVVVPDEWDMGLPAAFLLSYRMTENEVRILFQEILRLLPHFDTAYFMSDDTNSFYNGFIKVVPQSSAKKLLCAFHVIQSIKRYCKNLKKPSLTPTVVGKVSELCKSADRDVFSNNYASLLCFLRQNGEESMVQYFERNWSPRICEWAGFARRTSTVNTSMLIERFHRRLKHEFIQTKSSVRIDSLVDLLINLVPCMEEDRRIKMARNVREGRHRLAEQHKRHANAIRMYCDGNITSDVESAGNWLVGERNYTYRVEQMPCDCDEILNNHCCNCNACGYGFKCTCLDDNTAGVSCIHVHVALIYSP